MEIKTHILCSITLFEKLAVYEIMWKNTVEWGQGTDDSMAQARCMLDN
jgi:hypothetical protein